MDGVLVSALHLQLAPTGVAVSADLVVFLLVGILAGDRRLAICGPLARFYADPIQGRRSNHHRDASLLSVVRERAVRDTGRGVGPAVVGALQGLGGTPFAHRTVVESLTTSRGGLHRVPGVAFVALGCVLLPRGLTSPGIGVPHVDIPHHQPLTES